MRPQVSAQASVELSWLPLGAGGWYVKLNGRLWEAIQARREHRRPLDLYHTALVVCVPEGRFVVENCWPIPEAHGPSRGVVVEGPVGSRQLGRWRVFRYEALGTLAGGGDRRRRRGGGQPPAAERRPGGGPSPPGAGALPAQPGVGRDELQTGEMWNSNSVIAWLLAQSGLPTDAIQPPTGGRAPGWQAGLTVAHRSPMVLAVSAPPVQEL